jgi:hypothetical protein
MADDLELDGRQRRRVEHARNPYGATWQIREIV